MSETADASLLFHHKNNITCGKGRVLWARGCTDASGNAHHEGWTLPGGKRTQDREAAMYAAQLIDDLSKAACDSAVAGCSKGIA